METETVGERWLRLNGPHDYDASKLPDAGDVIDGRCVTSVDRRKGQYTLGPAGDGCACYTPSDEVVVLPRVKR